MFWIIGIITKIIDIISMIFDNEFINKKIAKEVSGNRFENDWGICSMQPFILIFRCSSSVFWRYFYHASQFVSLHISFTCHWWLIIWNRIHHCFHSQNAPPPAVFSDPSLTLGQDLTIEEKPVVFAEGDSMQVCFRTSSSYLKKN